MSNLGIPKLDSLDFEIEQRHLMPSAMIGVGIGFGKMALLYFIIDQSIAQKITLAQ